MSNPFDSSDDISHRWWNTAFTNNLRLTWLRLQLAPALAAACSHQQQLQSTSSLTAADGSATKSFGVKLRIGKKWFPAKQIFLTKMMRMMSFVSLLLLQEGEPSPRVVVSSNQGPVQHALLIQYSKQLLRIWCALGIPAAAVDAVQRANDATAAKGSHSALISPRDFPWAAGPCATLRNSSCKRLYYVPDSAICFSACTHERDVIRVAHMTNLSFQAPRSRRRWIGSLEMKGPETDISHSIIRRLSCSVGAYY